MSAYWKNLACLGLVLSWALPVGYSTLMGKCRRMGRNSAAMRLIVRRERIGTGKPKLNIRSPKIV